MGSFERHNVDPARGLAYLRAHYTCTVAPPLTEAIKQFWARHKIKGTDWSQLRHLKAALDDFATSHAHSSIKLVTEDEVLVSLAQRALDKAKTWIDQRGDVQRSES